MVRTGRPKLPKDKVRSVKLSLRMTTGLHEALERIAEREGKPLGTYICDVLQSRIDDGRGE